MKTSLMPMVIFDIIITPTAKSIICRHSEIIFSVFSATCERSLNNQCVPILKLKHKMKLFSKYIVRLCITNNNTFTILHFSFWPISQIILIGNKIYKRASPSVNVITSYQQLSSIFKHGKSTQWTTENTGHHRLYYCCFGFLGWPKGHPSWNSWSWNGWWSCCSWYTRTRRFTAFWICREF